MNKRKSISKSTRTSVYLMYNGHCAYCGTEIVYKDMQVDHATPLRIGGADDISNYMPACRSCNHYKATLDIEGFRDYLSRLHKRLMRDSIPYQVAERFGIVKHLSDDVKFYFEELKVENMTNADRIRNMSDEELAEFIPCPYMKDPYDECAHGWHDYGCSKCKLEWLQSEAE